MLLTGSGCTAPLHINQLQFVGSHNSYKLAMSAQHLEQLRARDPEVAESLEYWHLPLAQQLDLGVRKLELDIFYDPEALDFVVGHVQDIDMNSLCATLSACLAEITTWSDQHPRHVPIWISFNAKDQEIEGLSVPAAFDAKAFAALDAQLFEMLPGRLITPADVPERRWPRLDDARGKILLILDEGGAKRALYGRNWQARPMFANWPEAHPGAAVMIVNDPVRDGNRIRRLVAAGFMVRTRADANTIEARRGDRSRLEAALASGAQAISTDYYLPAEHFGTDYVVRFAPRCNPRNTRAPCTVRE
ncbi:MAG: Ca2+-dependent phosphoinositide-specific phospholipase C [Pseudomonadota bacterium]